MRRSIAAGGLTALIVVPFLLVAPGMAKAACARDAAPVDNVAPRVCAVGVPLLRERRATADIRPLAILSEKPPVIRADKAVKLKVAELRRWAPVDIAALSDGVE